jgi:hypothetical protein
MKEMYIKKKEINIIFFVVQAFHIKSIKSINDINICNLLLNNIKDTICMIIL